MSFFCSRRKFSSFFHMIILLAGAVPGLRAQLPVENQPEVIHYRNLGIQPLMQGAVEGDFAPGVYLIPHDMIIPEGKTVTLFSGTTILLTQNAMLVVNGTLVCSGTREAPVVFRRLDNRKYFEAIDHRVETRWDGIYLPDSAKLKMSNTIVSESKYGIVISGKNVSMIFDSVRFVNNKFQNVKIGNKIMKINENSPIVFHYPEQKGVFQPPAPVKSATETIQEKKKGIRATTSFPYVRVAMGALGIVGLATTITGAVVFMDNEELLKETRDVKYQEKATAGRITAITGSILFGIGTAGFVWTFFY
jgi:hypothetical protein